MLLSSGAEGETRTPTEEPRLDPEPSVSTNSTTSARKDFYRKAFFLASLFSKKCTFSDLIPYHIVIKYYLLNFKFHSSCRPLKQTFSELRIFPVPQNRKTKKRYLFGEICGPFDRFQSRFTHVSDQKRKGDAVIRERSLSKSLSFGQSGPFRIDRPGFPRPAHVKILVQFR